MAQQQGAASPPGEPPEVTRSPNPGKEANPTTAGRDQEEETGTPERVKDIAEPTVPPRLWAGRGMQLPQLPKKNKMWAQELRGIDHPLEVKGLQQTLGRTWSGPTMPELTDA